MPSTQKLLIENVRCFAGRHVVPLSPITLLVGENSTGKSTFLAACRLAWESYRTELPDFNEEPFQLGAFDDIVTKTNGKPGYFSFGYVVPATTRDG